MQGKNKMTVWMMITLVVATIAGGLGVASHASAATLDAQSGSWGRRYYTIYLTRGETNMIAVDGAASMVKAANELRLLPLYLKQGATGTWGGLGSAAGIVLAANVVTAVVWAKAAKAHGQCLIGYMSGWPFFVAPFVGWAYGPCLA